MPKSSIISSIIIFNLVLGGCSALPEASSIGEPIESVRPSVPGTQLTSIGLPATRFAVAPDVSTWDQKTSTPAIIPDYGVTDWVCGGVIFSEPPSHGPWRFVGTAETYTPVLDIVADRTGLPVQSNATYYLFRLQPDDE